MADLISRAAVLAEMALYAPITEGGELAWAWARKVVERAPDADPLAVIEAAKSLRVAVEQEERDADVAHLTEWRDALTGEAVAESYATDRQPGWSALIHQRAYRVSALYVPARQRMLDIDTQGAARAWMIAQLRAEGWTVVERKEGGG